MQKKWDWCNWTGVPHLALPSACHCDAILAIHSRLPGIVGFPNESTSAPLLPFPTSGLEQVLQHLPLLGPSGHGGDATTKGGTGTIMHGLFLHLSCLKLPCTKYMLPWNLKSFCNLAISTFSPVSCGKCKSPNNCYSTTTALFSVHDDFGQACSFTLISL